MEDGILYVGMTVGIEICLKHCTVVLNNSQLGYVYGVVLGYCWANLDMWSKLLIWEDCHVVLSVCHACVTMESVFSDVNMRVVMIKNRNHGRTCDGKAVLSVRVLWKLLRGYSLTGMAA